MKSFTAFITEAISSQTVAKPNPNGDEADMTVAFGRFNPPTTGHERLLNKVNRLLVKVTMKFIHQDQMTLQKIH